MGDAHGHAHDLAPHLASVDGVRRGQGELQHVLDVLEGPTVSKHPAALRHVGQGLPCWALGGFEQLGFFVGLHDVLADGGLLEGGVHCGEVVRFHALLGDVRCMCPHQPAEMIDAVDGPVALQPTFSLSFFVGRLQAGAHMIQDFHHGFA
jgi:hypothetical protein